MGLVELGLVLPVGGGAPRSLLDAFPAPVATCERLELCFAPASLAGAWLAASFAGVSSRKLLA